MNSVYHRVKLDDQILLTIRDIKYKLVNPQGVPINDVLRMSTDLFCLCKDDQNLSHHIDELLFTVKTVNIRFLSVFIRRLYMGNLFSFNPGEIPHDLHDLKHCIFNSRTCVIYADSDDYLYVVFKAMNSKFFFEKAGSNDHDIRWGNI